VAGEVALPATPGAAAPYGWAAVVLTG
jgi:hypothetical protein